MRLGDLLTDAGLTVERYACRAPVLRVPPGMRPPSWAARDDMVAAGFATEADIKRWEEAFALRSPLMGDHMPDWPRESGSCLLA
jgi:hypothetical protein